MSTNDAILYIEDGPDDVFFMQRAFKKIAPDLELRIMTNGQEALDFFASAPASAPLGPPLSLVILDLNLPGASGLEVLAQLRTKSNYAKVPVILFSASSQQADIDACYAAGCNSYLVKPNDPDHFKALVSKLHDYWIKENRYSKTSGTLAIISDHGKMPAGH